MKVQNSKLPSGIRQVSSGKFQIRYTGPDGKRYSGGTYRTKTDARTALAIIQASISDRSWRQKKAQIDDGQLSGKNTLAEWSEEWIRTRTSRKTGQPLANGTQRYYRNIINSGLKSFDRPIQTITSSQIRKWWASYRLEYPRAANSAYKYLNSLLGLAARRNAIPENPCDIDGAASWEPRPKGRLSPRESIDRLIQDSENPWKAFFAITVFGGLRRGEVAELRIEDVIADQNSSDRVALDIRRSATWITNSEVEVSTPKSRAGNRVVWLGPTGSKILLEYLEDRPRNPEALLFSSDQEGVTHLRESTIRNQVNLARKRFGLKESLHRLRDYSLTLYAQQGATLQEIMARGGHSNVQAAMAYQRDAGRDADLAARMG
jgi:integrase